MVLLLGACGAAESDSTDKGELVCPSVEPQDIAEEELPPVEEVVELQETSPPDVGTEEIAQGCSPGEGCFLEPCANDWDCSSGICVHHLGDPVCTRTCDDDCDEGWSCEELSGAAGSTVKACLSNHTHLCLPCHSDDDCVSPTGVEDVCVDYGEGGNFCGSFCSGGGCPNGYSCESADTVDGDSYKLCVAVVDTCACSTTAIQHGLGTTCSVTNDYGTCTGDRWCTVDGLSDCDAAVPAEEVCNGLDDDCDEQWDEEVDCGDDNPCTNDYCDGEAGCANDPNWAPCDDGDACTENDACSDGTCAGAATLDCDDGNPCTDDWCEPDSGCVNDGNDDACDDGDPCTVGDYCDDGECTPGGSSPCEDGNECTDDSCDPLTGCTYTANNHTCDDGNPCTTGDYCEAGACSAATEADCNDDNPCTDDGCDPDSGCYHEDNHIDCSDSNACTMNDVCEDGECVSGEELSCNDGNECTDDSCYNDFGCVYVANKSSCDDGNPCTTGDTCINGGCIGLDMADCDDGNPCTEDSCNALAGCVYSPVLPCCGNGVIEPGELCDDGNVEDGDECSSMCTLAPPASCVALHEGSPSLPSGTYVIDPDGGGPDAPFAVYCDMVTDGGGWTLVMKLSKNDFCYESERWTDEFGYNEQYMLDPVLPAAQQYDAKSLAFFRLQDTTKIRFYTSRGFGTSVVFAEPSSPRILMTTNIVDFASYPDFEGWQKAFGAQRQCAPIFMRGGQCDWQGSCRTFGDCPIGCGQPCMFCFQASDGDYECPSAPGQCGSPWANDVTSGVGHSAAYCGGGSEDDCSSAGDWADSNLRTLVWAK